MDAGRASTDLMEHPAHPFSLQIRQSKPWNQAAMATQGFYSCLPINQVFCFPQELVLTERRNCQLIYQKLEYGFFHEVEQGARQIHLGVRLDVP